MTKVAFKLRGIVHRGVEIDAWGTHCNVSEGRSLAITESRSFVLVPKFSEKGDVICSVDGAKSLYVVRKIEGGTGKLVGDCYVLRAGKQVTTSAAHWFEYV